MNKRNRDLVVIGFVLAAGLGGASSGLAQVQHKMQLKVEPPKAVVSPTGTWQPKAIARPSERTITQLNQNFFIGFVCHEAAALSR